MKYRLTEKLGSGGMAEVFRAVGEGPAAFERPFVVKRIHPRLSGQPEFVRMFVDEANISARLIHPNIVQVFEFASQDGSYYLVMEPVEGIDMAWLLRRRIDKPSEQLSPAFVAEVGRQVCRGLDFAHTLTDANGTPLGIVHRDVTPPNIMVSWNGDVKILDFGLARAAQALRLHQSDDGMVRGKMSYLAPELLDGATADPRSDLFSLGVVLHELLSGERLFVGESDFDTLKLVQTMTIPRPSSRNHGVKPALEAVVMRALERDPARRYQSAGEMGDELEALVLRKQYSTRALARKARELADKEPIIEKVGPTPLITGAPPTVGRTNSSILIDESLLLPAGAGRAPTARRRGSRPAWRWLAVGAVPGVFIGVLLGAGLRPDPAPVAAVPTPAPETTPPPPPAPPATSAPAPTVRVALDSSPQGATVTGAAGPLGKTPLQLEVPRSQEAMALTFTKPGFAALALKVVPQQDKDILASLQRAGGRSPLAAGSVPGGASQTKTVRVTTTTTSRTERTVASPAAITRGPPPAATTRGPPPVGPRR
jgi:serine/threonine protein kinase